MWLKQTNPNIGLAIITNGSYKPAVWWQSLGAVLDYQDEIHWSIDGWDQQSNQQYRVNSNWQSVIEGINAFANANQSTYRVWATIGFKFNQHHIEHIKQLAADLNFDCFQLTKSTKFGSHYPDTYGRFDPLCPDRADLVSSSHRFERVLNNITNRARPGKLLKEIFWARAQDLDRHKQYSGICLIGNKGVFLNSQGEFYPCCWTANRYPHNNQWHEQARERFNLWHRNFSDIIADDFWTKEFLEFNSQECTTKCTPDLLKDREHVTEW
jgi:MoaA/NifB/PqqE/SkfB family radical SAM enzyme